MYCKDCSNALQEKINYVRCDKQVLTGGPMNMLISSPDLEFSDLDLFDLGHSTPNETMAHALRPRILFTFFNSVLPNCSNPKFELPTPNSFSVKIIFVTHSRARF